MPTKVRDLKKMLRDAGFQEQKRTSGTSHVKWRHPDGRLVVVPGEDGDVLRVGTERSILKKAGLK